MYVHTGETSTAKYFELFRDVPTSSQPGYKTNCPCCPNHKAWWNIESEDYRHTFSVYPRCPYKFPAWLQNSNCPACHPNHKAWWNIYSEEDTHTFSVYPR
uniref:Uncharacterized protein n=1 Tax=Magallana gigas TaxID=29159 RepID=K1Q7V0_MAGGI